MNNIDQISNVTPLALGLLALIFSYVVARLKINIATLDIPNERSSHSKPTPTGGGLGIALCLIACALFLSFTNSLSYLGLASGLLLLTIIGWIDDKQPVNALARISIQVVATLSCALPILNIDNVNLWLYPLVILGIVWLINLYNFMDGTDGLASIQTLIFTVGALVLFWRDIDPRYATLLAVTAGASLGFLLLNRPPASIFMGDVGSTTLGLTIGVTILGLTHTWLECVALCILLAGFIVDASWTLGRRVLTGQQFWQAHRLHAYQKFAARSGHHSSVLVWYLFTGVFLQLPLAYYTLHSGVPHWTITLVPAITIHAVFCYIMRAGQPFRAGVDAQPSHQ